MLMQAILTSRGASLPSVCSTLVDWLVGRCIAFVTIFIKFTPFYFISATISLHFR